MSVYIQERLNEIIKFSFSLIRSPEFKFNFGDVTILNILKAIFNGHCGLTKLLLSSRRCNFKHTHTHKK